MWGGEKDLLKTGEKKNGFQVRARHTNERLTETKTTKQLPERGQDFSCLSYNKESWYFLSM